MDKLAADRVKDDAGRAGLCVENDRLDSVLQALQGRSILTVSDLPDFTSRGGMIELYMEKNKIRMRISLAVVKAAGLSISSKLLRLAETRF